MAGKREMIAKNIAAMLHDGDVVNLGVGIPTLVGNYVPEGMTVWFQGENGCIGVDNYHSRGTLIIMKVLWDG